MTTLLETKSIATQILKDIVLDQDNLLSILETSFGSDYDPLTGEQIFGQWRQGNFSNLPLVTILPTEDMFGATGAYDSKGNRVYLSQSLMDTENISLIKSVLLEEYAHFLDAQINLVDTPGDEGAIFSLLARGEDISPELLTTLQNKDDSGFVKLTDN